jgi:predicted GIY-YIG superfamily endonuclease
MTYYVYIVKCADKTLYVGCTNNLEKRILQHNTSKQGAHYTKIRRPVALIYSEQFTTLAEGRKREAQIKRMKREEKIQLIESK